MNSENNIVNEKSRKKLINLGLGIGILIGLVIGFGIGKMGFISSGEVQSGNRLSEPESESQELVESALVPVDLATGTWICGEDIVPGKYLVTPVNGGEDVGNLIIHGSTDVSEVLGDGKYSTMSVTVTIEEGDTIEIANMPGAHFEPVQ